jgi:hypothetical protein
MRKIARGAGKSRRTNWQTADRSSARLLPTAADHAEALIRIYAARWRVIR